MPKVYCNPKITLRDDAKNRANIMAARAERREREVMKAHMRVVERMDALRHAQEVG